MPVSVGETRYRVFRRWAANRFELAMELNLRNIDAALSDVEPGARLLDLGCDDGERTLRFAAAACASAACGIEVAPSQAAKARARGIDVRTSDLAAPFPFGDGAFDVVVSNQVVEHVPDTDHFVAEARRVLRPGGLAVLSTENLASWHNVAALTLGWQPFSLTNVTATRAGLGNPLAVHRAEAPGERTWQHQRVFAARGLRELLGAHGFRDVELTGAGYFPLRAGVGRRDPRHAVFVVVTGRA